uniref:Putative secreted protein n=2 Tax=Ixodes ricinus TaxID=34613 RepID=A0A090XET1_IXORI
MKVFEVALCLFATLRGVSLAVNSRTIDNAWQLSNEIGQFQKASEVITHKGVYYLVFGTKNLPYDCVASTVTAMYDSDKAASYKRIYITSSQKTEVTGSASVASDIRGQGTVIYMSIMGYERRVKYQVVFAERNKCHILHNPETGAYQLWVNQDEVKYLPRGCDFVYWLVTYRLETHIIYNEEKCKLV